MIKLTLKKIACIIKKKGRGTTKIAWIMKIMPEYVNMIYNRYKEEGEAVLKNPRRKK
jgi:hypothetical protein